MTFDAFREVMRAAYTLQKGGDGRGVILVKPDIMLQTGEVTSVRFEGHGWSKTVPGDREACLRFLSGEGGADQPDDKRAFNDIVDALIREFGVTAVEAGDEFGVREVTFSVPIVAIKKALKEKEDESVRIGRADRPAGEHSG